MQRPSSRIETSTATAALLACLLAGPASAGSVSTDPIAAAFYACAGQPVTIEHRIETLTTAGWKIAADSPPLRDLFAQVYNAGMQGHYISGEAPLQRAALTRTKVDPVSRLEADGSGEPTIVRLAAGPITQLADLIQFAAAGKASGVLYFSSPDDSGLLRMHLFAPQASKSGYSLYCNLYLHAPLTEAYVDDHMPSEVSRASLSRDHKTSGDKFYQVSYSTMAGYAGKVTYVDATKLAPLKAYVARSGSTPMLSSVLTFESQNVLLTDTLSRTRKVKQ